jgi:hypothetical protein
MMALLHNAGGVDPVVGIKVSGVSHREGGGRSPGSFGSLSVQFVVSIESRVSTLLLLLLDVDSTKSLSSAEEKWTQ